MKPQEPTSHLVFCSVYLLLLFQFKIAGLNANHASPFISAGTQSQIHIPLCGPFLLTGKQEHHITSSSLYPHLQGTYNFACTGIP